MKIAALLVIGLCLPGCDSLSRNKTVERSHFQKKVECQKHEAEIKKGLSTNSEIGIQTLDRIFYSPSLDSCLDIIYSVYLGKSKSKTGGDDLKLVGEINDVLTGRNFWRREYPATGPGKQSYEQVIADADRKIQEQG